MSPRLVIVPRALALGLALAAALGACSGGGNQTAAPSTATGSGAVGSSAAACATAPSVGDDLPGWGPPAAAPELTPFIIASPGQLVCGPNRVLFTVLDTDGRPAGAPELATKVEFFNLGRDPAAPIATADGAFIWAIEGVRGIYAADVTFPEAGRYGAAFTVGGGDPIRLTFDVQPTSAVVKVGDRAPASKTPTLASVGGDVSRISTDSTPDPKLYETSVDAALSEHVPFVLIFATPKFCTSAQCGPTLDKLKPYVAKYPTVTFINVEPYKLKLVDGVLEPELNAENQLQTAPTTDEWHLFNEPHLFVVDRDGIVRASFELMFSDQELTTALDAVK